MVIGVSIFIHTPDEVAVVFSGPPNGGSLGVEATTWYES